MIISTVSLKGGVGKTTLAINLGVFFAQNGHSVLLIDADENSNSVKWSGIREKGKYSITTISLSNAAALRNNINSLREKAEIIIIDGTPAINEIANTIMLISDVAIFPIQASPLDLWAFDEKFLPKFNQIKVVKPELLGLICLNNLDNRTKLSKEISEAVDTFNIPVLKTTIGDRAIYKDSIAYGLSALECDNIKAIKEINDLGNEIVKLINN